MGDQIDISVVIPLWNEEAYIDRCLSSLTVQDYPASKFEVLIADGQSSDSSREVVEGFRRRFPNFKFLDNPKRITSAGLNTGIRNARGNAIVILGAHTAVAPDFLRKNLEYLRKTGSDCVGGRIVTQSHTNLGRAIALALSSPFGVGDAYFRYSQEERFVDTVAFGCYQRGVFERLGFFDEDLVRNQDDEFNYRLIKSGGKIYLTPEIKATYFSRSTLVGLIQQYFRYGFWKVRVIQKHPGQTRLRHLIPSLFLGGLAGLLLLGFVSEIFWMMLGGVALLYLISAFSFSVKIATREGIKWLFLSLPMYPLIHFSYGSGFLAGLFRFASRWDEERRRKKRYSHPYSSFYQRHRLRNIIGALDRVSMLPMKGKTILDVGCGSGDLFFSLRESGADPDKLYGMDIRENKIKKASFLHEEFNFLRADGEMIPFRDGSFDIISQCTVFTSVLDYGRQERIAAEMLRVLKPGGVIIWYDMIYTKPFNPRNRGIKKKRIKELFPDCQIDFRIVTFNPVIARAIIKLFPALCEFLERKSILGSFYLSVIKKNV